MLRSPAVDTPSALLPPGSRRKVKPDFVSLKYQSCALLLKRVIAVSPQLSASLCKILPLGLLSALFRLWRIAPRTRQRQVRAAALCIVQTLITCISLVLSPVPSTCCLTFRGSRVDLVIYKIQLSSRFCSCLGLGLGLLLLCLTTWLLSVLYRLLPSSLYHYHSSYQYLPPPR